MINSFTKWIEANKGLVASIAVTAGSIATLGAALLAIGTVSRVLSAGVGALSGVFGAFAGVASALAGKGVVVQGAFSLMARAFADYRNAAIPAMVGTSLEINANSDKIADARRRLAAIEEGDEEALTGGKTEHEKQEEKVKRHGPRRPCCPSRAATRDSRRRCFAAYASACRLRIHAHGR